MDYIVCKTTTTATNTAININNTHPCIFYTRLLYAGWRGTGASIGNNNLYYFSYRGHTSFNYAISKHVYFFRESLI